MIRISSVPSCGLTFLRTSAMRRCLKVSVRLSFRFSITFAAFNWRRCFSSFCRWGKWIVQDRSAQTLTSRPLSMPSAKIAGVRWLQTLCCGNACAPFLVFLLITST